MSEDASNASPSRRAKRNTTNRVRLVTHPSAEASETGLGKTIFESDDEAEARKYVETHHPRGAEVVLQTADGKVGHFSADHKAQGHEDNGWFDYDSED
jgi:hypothetical protein